MNSDLISVIIPVFNTGRSCLKLLKSLELSTHKNIEIICIDDGSSDDSYKVLTEYVSKSDNNNIIIKRQKNGGPSSARNAGLKLAHGKWISFLDSDDLIKKDFLSELISAYDDGNTLLACTAILYKRLAKNTSHIDFINAIRDRESDESIKEYVVYLMLKDGRLYSAINKLFRRDIITENNIHFSEKMNFAEDTKFVLNYIDAALKYYPYNCKIKFIHKPLYVYNFGTKTSTVSKSSLDWRNWKISYRVLDSWSRDNNTITMKRRKLLVLCRWRISHALAVTRSNTTIIDKCKYINLLELLAAKLLIKLRP